MNPIHTATLKQESTAKNSRCPVYSGCMKLFENQDLTAEGR
jgi:hypothetical protein